MTLSPARPVYDCKYKSYARRAHIAYKSRLMLAPPICDLRRQSKRAIPLLMNNHGITIESFYRAHSLQREIFYFRLLHFCPQRSCDTYFDASYPDFLEFENICEENTNKNLILAYFNIFIFP